MLLPRVEAHDLVDVSTLETQEDHVSLVVDVDRFGFGGLFDAVERVLLQEGAPNLRGVEDLLKDVLHLHEH